MLDNVETVHETDRAVWTLNLDRGTLEYCTRSCSSLAVWQQTGPDWIGVQRLGRGGPRTIPGNVRAKANSLLNAYRTANA